MSGSPTEGGSSLRRKPMAVAPSGPSLRVTPASSLIAAAGSALASAGPSLSSNDACGNGLFTSAALSASPSLRASVNGVTPNGSPASSRPSSPRMTISSARAVLLGITAAVAVSAAVTLWVPMEGVLSAKDLVYEATVDAKSGHGAGGDPFSEVEVEARAARDRAQWSPKQGPRPTEGAGCATDGFRVCSHQLLGLPAVSNQGPVSTASGTPSHALTPAASNYNATATLLGLLTHTGVGCFDVDAFLAGDGVVMIGHPGKESARLGVTIPALEALASSALAAHGLMSLDALAAVVRSLPHAVDLITIEPKDVLKNDPRKLLPVAQLIAADPILSVRLALIVNNVADAGLLKEEAPSVQLACSILDQGRQDIPGDHGICDPARPPLDRLHVAMRLYSIVMPSQLAMDMQGCSSVLTVLSVERRVKIMAWLVDTEAQLQALRARPMNVPTHIISNVPLAVAPTCGGPTSVEL